MAGDWIKMRCDLHEDPAVIQMAGRLEVSEREVVGALHRVWSWANRQSRNGHAPGVTFAWLDRYIGVSDFCDAMSEVGWIDLQSGELIFPKFDRHNGQPAKSRALASDRQQKRRDALRSEDAPHVTPQSRIQRDAGVTREEKRREEEHTPPTPSLCDPEKRVCDEPNPVRTPSQAGAICRAMRQAGVQDVNPGNPDLLALIAAGATEAEFVAAAQTASRKGKGFAYAVAALIGQRQEAAKKAGQLQATSPNAGLESEPWHATAGGVKAKGAELGVPYGREDECHPFDRYRSRVFAAAGHQPQPGKQA